MATNVDSGKANQSSSVPASSTPAAGESPYRFFEEAYGSYATCLQDAWLAAQGKVTEARSKYLQRLREAQLELQTEVQDAYQSASKAVEEAAKRENEEELRAAAHRKLVDALNAAVGNAWKKADEIKRDYWGNAEDARSEYASGNDACYRSFLKDLQNAWASIDAANINVQQLNLISHLMFVAAHTAHTRLGPV